MDLLGTSGGPEKTADLGISFVVSFLGKREIFCIGIALSVESGLQILEGFSCRHLGF